MKSVSEPSADVEPISSTWNPRGTALTPRNPGGSEEKEMPGTSSLLRERSISVESPEVVVTSSSVVSAVTNSTRCHFPRTWVRPALRLVPVVSTSARCSR